MWNLSYLSYLFDTSYDVLLRCHKMWWMALFICQNCDEDKNTVKDFLAETKIGKKSAYNDVNLLH